MAGVSEITWTVWLLVILVTNSNATQRFVGSSYKAGKEETSFIKVVQNTRMYRAGFYASDYFPRAVKIIIFSSALN